MKKKEFNYKIIIGLLVAIIVILIGFFIYFVEESIDEKEEIRHINNTYENNTNTSNNDTSTTDNTNQNYISRDEALTIALKDANINQNDIRDIDVELDYKSDQTVYEVNFNYKQYEYEYYINAESGNIVKSFRERD